MTNRLSSEKSPYLLGHSENPVDWFPWGEEAFAEAKRLDRPIFLSIGYATCHWCHVMEKESFVDEGVAELLNAGFVSVKVDREERPDVDQVYMRVCQTLTGRGGWPLTVIMTPEGAPFFAGTYIPKEPRGDGYGLPGLLSAITMMWAEKRPDLLEASEKLTKALALSSRPYPGGSLKAYTPMLFSSAAAELGQSYDADYGGFSEAPKFPTPHHLTFLLRRSWANGSRNLGDMALTTLDMLRRGGIWDHVGGGFHRYSTDRRWFLPHFEKMAYDQAGLANAFLEAFQATGNPAWADGARDALKFADSVLSDPEGGFYCGLDADSAGAEGRFYLWSVEEIVSVLGANLGAEFCRVHGATAQGNFREETGEKVEGQNVLALGRDADWHAISRRFADAYAALAAARELRPKPLTDDKILAGWSGLLASAFARAGGALGDAVYVGRAEKAVEFVFSRFWANGRLLRSYRNGPSSINGFAEDYAYLARACLDLHRATLKPLHLERAVQLAGKLKELFLADDGGLNDAPSDGEKLLFTPREATDGAMLSAASAGLEVFARLALITRDEGWTELARGLMGGEAGLVSRFPSAFTHFLQGAALVVENPRTLTFSGAGVEKLHRAALSAYAPDTEFRLEGGAGVAKALLCDSTACLADIIDAEGLILALRQK